MSDSQNENDKPEWAKPPTHVSSCTGMLDTLLRTKTLDELAPYMVSTYYPFTRKAPAPVWSPPEGAAKGGPPVIEVVEQDCVECGLELAEKFGLKKVAVLNMANEHNSGGGWDHVTGSQEEYLFRRTSVGLSLWPHRASG